MVVVVLLGAGEDVSFASARGPLIVLGAPVSFAVYNVLLRPLLDRYDHLALTAASRLVGTLALVPVGRGALVVAGVAIAQHRPGRSRREHVHADPVLDPES